MVSLYLGTCVCFLVSVLIVKGGMRCTLVVKLILFRQVAYLVRTFGLNRLWVAVYSFCENVHAGCHCDPSDARLAVRLCTTDGAHLWTAWNPTTRIKEVRRANTVITPERGV